MQVQINGIDISHWQDGDIDYEAAKNAGVRFIYHKASEGSTYSDNNYTRRRVEAARVGIPFGAYHFARPNYSNAKKEAYHFLKVSSPKPGDMIPVLDLEVNEKKMSRAALTRWVGDFLSVFHARGIKVMIYTPFDLNKTFNAPLWVARYSNAMTPPRIPAPWKNFDIWQFSDGTYGSPNTVPGVGKVDINYLNPSTSFRSLRISPPVQTLDLDIWHFSMQFSDGDKQHAHDASVAFDQGADIVTGTEAGAGSGNLVRELRTQAKKSGYWFYSPRRTTGCWVAVKKTISPRRPRTGFIPVIPSSRVLKDRAHAFGTRGIVWVEFKSPDIGKVAVGSIHLLTKGRYPGQSKKDDLRCPIDHYAKNLYFGRRITKWAKNAGKGKAIAFVGGDTNLIDKDVDVFASAGLLRTCWDDKKAWPSTGHGNIDVIARYVRDNRVEFVSAEVQNDRKLFMYTDHFPIRATYRVKKI